MKNNKITKTLLVAAIVGSSSLVVPDAFSQSYSGIDGNGNYYSGRISESGRFSGIDGNGNYYSGRIRR